MSAFGERFESALDFAREAHRGQVRKGSLVPYITHPVAVSEILAQFGYPDDVVVAGLLHDVVEDTATTLAEIEARFGPAVAALVDAVTERKIDHGVPIAWEERKAGTVQHLRTAPAEVVALKAADTLHNVTTITRDLRLVGEAVWGRFNRGRDDQLRYYHGVVQVIQDRLDEAPLAAELREAVRRLSG